MSRDQAGAISIAIREEPITLSQFLKMAQALTGGEAKTLVYDGAVRVNGELELRRSRKLLSGDVVEVAQYGRFEITLER